MVNNLLNVWSTIGSVVLAILMLLVMITIHELGHYIAGKILKFKIDEFAIGFGPALFKRKRKKTSELFSIRLIPLGGYCAFAGEDGLEDEKEKKKTEGEGEPFADLQQQNAEAVVPSEDTAKPVTEIPEAENAPASEAEAPVDKSGFFTHKKPWQRIIVLVAGAFMNYVLAVILLIVCFFAYGQTMIAVYEAEPTDEFPQEYCLKDKDIFLKAEGKNLYLTTDIAKAVNGRHKGDLVEFEISRVVGTTEDGKNVREEMTVTVMLRADVTVKNSADLNGVWEALGLKYETVQNEDGSEGGGSYMVASASYKFGFFQTLGRAFVYSFKIAGSIFKIIGELLTGHLGISALGGPVTTIAMTSQIARQSFRGFLEIAGFIGVNLAVFNLLPIPALDGSKIVFTVIEWIRKKPISRKVEAIIHAVGFLLLLGFAILVDVLQFVL